MTKLTKASNKKLTADQRRAAIKKNLEKGMSAAERAADIAEMKQDTKEIIERNPEFKTNTQPPRIIAVNKDGNRYGIKNKDTREFVIVLADDIEHAKRATKWNPFSISYAMQIGNSNDAPNAEGRGDKGNEDKDMSKGTLESLKAAREAKAAVKAIVIKPIASADGKVVDGKKLSDLEADLTASLKKAKDAHTMKTGHLLVEAAKAAQAPKKAEKKAATKVSAKKTGKGPKKAPTPLESKDSAVKRGKIFLFGFPVTSVVRWAGKQGLSFAETVGALKALKVKPMPTDNCIKTFLYAGKAGQRGAPAALNQKQAAELKAAAKAA